MSTNIYHGRIIRNCTLEQALVRLKTIRPKCVELAQQAIAKEIAKKRCLWLDMDQNFHPIPRKEKEQPFWRMLELLKTEKAQVDSGVRSRWDFTLEVCLIPMGNDILCLLFLENNPGYQEALASIGVENYAYQNSTDKPDEISSEEWTSREEAWSKAIGRDVPAAVGFTYQLVHWDDARKALWDRDLVLNSSPDEDHRRYQVALRLVDPDIEPYDAGKHHLFEHVKLAESAARQRAPHVYLSQDLIE